MPKPPKKRPAPTPGRRSTIQALDYPGKFNGTHKREIAARVELWLVNSKIRHRPKWKKIPEKDRPRPQPYTWSWLAVRADIPRTHLTDCLKGSKPLTLASARKLGKAMRVTLRWLVYGNGDD